MYRRATSSRSSRTSLYPSIKRCSLKTSSTWRRHPRRPWSSAHKQDIRAHRSVRILSVLPNMPCTRCRCSRCCRRRRTSALSAPNSAAQPWRGPSRHARPMNPLAFDRHLLFHHRAATIALWLWPYPAVKSAVHHLLRTRGVGRNPESLLNSNTAQGVESRRQRRAPQRDAYLP